MGIFLDRSLRAASSFLRPRRSDAVDAAWLSFSEAASAPAGSRERVIADWFVAYLMSPHPELGRSGHVCPYMAKASRLDLVRLCISDLSPDRPSEITALVTAAEALFDDIACPASKRVFRTVVMVFPACTGAEGTAALEKIQHSLRYRSAFNRRMLGLFEPGSVQPGIANRDLQSFRAPLPVLAIRSLVELDAPFVLRNPPMIPVYLKAFGASGRGRLVEAIRERAAARWRRQGPAPG